MTQYSISLVGTPSKARLFAADGGLTDIDFDRIAHELRRYGCETFQARKVSWVSARQANTREIIETSFKGNEARHEAMAGDWIVTNMDSERRILRDQQGRADTYVVRKDKFLELYDRDKGENEFGEVYNAKGVVDAVELPGGFDIIASWGERQQRSSGYLLRNGVDVYGIETHDFSRTYERYVSQRT